MIIDNQIEFTCESRTSAIKKESVTICILDKKGIDEAFFHIMCDKFSNLRKFSGEILDKTGRSLRKIKKSDLQMTEFSSGLASDDYMYYYECRGPSYPFIVKYEWEIKYKDGLIAFPMFIPQKEWNQSVMNASYRFFYSPDVPYRYKTICSDAKPEKKSDGKNSYEEIVFNNLKALDPEPYGPSLTQVVPRVRFDPIRFYFDGKEGNMESWESYGLWQNSLLKDRDQLPEDFKNKLKAMTAHCTSDREKVETLYNYLGETTRYVSIQLGIGGFQPISAEKVHKAGFGDCKGLSNYMLAMLKAVGIPSHYAEISTRQAHFHKDYMSANQTNHVILQVPLENDTLWLECTNPQLPFGYIHQDIAGHDALLIKEHGGEICRLPQYPDSLNTQTTQAVITLTEEGRSSIKVSQSSQLVQYEDMCHFVKRSPDKQKEYILSTLSMNKATVKEIQAKEVKKAHPDLDISYTVDCELYGSKTGNRLFIPVNPFRHRSNIRNKNRVHDIYINYGFTDIDLLTIKIPDGYTVEALPNPAIIINEFGQFVSLVIAEEKEIKIIHRLYLKTGKYPKDIFDSFVGFNQAVSNCYKDKIILRRDAEN